ncbi:ragulator complex protein LAMTOR3 [Onthophagus taurus]|uniref:ragulator complex protein LAMTOR3 n=1 Tax=Onthophagus taurus TaxID=166361 RepID=UPI000C209D30|nr:ragulator complex protein LAMTOR3 [Onthophagus taurus]
MVEEVKKYLQQFLTNVSGLYSIIISDRDGVPVMVVTSESSLQIATKPTFLSTFSLAVDQGRKFGLGKMKTLICSYSQYQVIQMNKLPLIITFIASDSANTGHILSLEEQIEPVLSNLVYVVAEN